MSRPKPLPPHLSSRNIAPGTGLLNHADPAATRRGRNHEQSDTPTSTRGSSGRCRAAYAVPRAQAAAPLAEKQNPGWHRYKVGSFEVTVVTDGATTSPLADN